MLIALGKSAGRFHDAGADRHVRSVQADFGLCPQRTDTLRQERMGARAKVMGTDCPHVRIRDRRNGVEDIVHLAGIRLGTTDQMPLLEYSTSVFWAKFFWSRIALMHRYNRVRCQRLPAEAASK